MVNHVMCLLLCFEYNTLECNRVQGWVQVTVWCNEKLQEILERIFKLSVYFRFSCMFLLNLSQKEISAENSDKQSLLLKGSQDEVAVT